MASQRQSIDETPIMTYLKENCAIIPAADTEVPRGGRFPALAAAIGFVFTFCAFYPGVLSSDSLDQFQQALNFHFSDWHPPAMAILWSLLTRIWSGPQLMLLVQESLFWGGVYLLLSALDIRSLWARIIVILLLFSPVLLNFSGVIWKDVQLASAWIFVLASVFATRQRGIPLSGAHKAGLLILILYGALVRINAGIAAGPLVLYALTGRAQLDSLWRSVAVYVGLALTCFFLGQGVCLSILLGIPVIDGYIETGLVPRLPTAVLALGIMLLAFIAFFTGLTLDSVSRGRREAKMIAYLGYSSPGRKGEVLSNRSI